MQSINSHWLFGYRVQVNGIINGIHHRVSSVFKKKNTSHFFLSEAYILPDHKEIDITMTLGYWDYVEKIK